MCFGSDSLRGSAFPLKRLACAQSQQLERQTGNKPNMPGTWGPAKWQVEGARKPQGPFLLVICASLPSPSSAIISCGWSQCTCCVQGLVAQSVRQGGQLGMPHSARLVDNFTLLALDGGFFVVVVVGFFFFFLKNLQAQLPNL